MEFDDKGWQQGEGVMTLDAIETVNRNRIRFSQGDKAADVAPVPPKASRLIAKLALTGF